MVKVSIEEFQRNVYAIIARADAGEAFEICRDDGTAFAEIRPKLTSPRRPVRDAAFWTAHEESKAFLAKGRPLAITDEKDG